jgi:DNA helicase-2/ATP-dependent DNA helicase PcrA
MKRVINYPKRGIGDTTVQKIVVGATEKNLGIWDMLERSPELGINGATWNKIQEFITLIKSFR